MSVFDAYAHYYDLLYRDKDYLFEVEYINENIQRYNPGAVSILEFGCGTGAHAELLAQKGYRIHGIDQSKVMLERADKRWGALENEVAIRLTKSQGDIRTVRIEHRFDVVVALFHVISYLQKNVDLEAAFRSAAYHLSKGGIFVFDFWHGPGVLTQRPENRRKEFEDDQIHVVRHATPAMYATRNLVDVHYQIDILSKSDGTHKIIQENHGMRYLFIPEIEYLLNKSGFSLTNCEEWLTGKPPGYDTWYALVVAKRL